MKPRAWLPASCLLAALVPACSLTGLDRFEFPACGECELLNMRDGIAPGACELWQCDVATGDCTFGGRDADGDRAVAAECGGPDCDDSSADARPGGTEACDGVDNDCNGLVDDLASAPEDPIQIADTGDTPDWVGAADREDGVYVAWGTPAASTAIVTGAAGAATVAPLGLATASAPMAITGCVRPTATPFTPRTLTPCTTPADCTVAGETCVMGAGGASFCETPITCVPGPGRDCATQCATRSECDDGDPCDGLETCEPFSPAADARGCREQTRACSAGQTCDRDRLVCVAYPAPTACSVADLAFASIGDGEWIGAAVTPEGCAAGVLRVGYFGDDDRRAAPRGARGVLLQRGGDERTRTWAGVDSSTGGAGTCTGASRGTGAPQGAGGLGVAALAPSRDRPVPQGIVAYLAAPVCRASGACSGSEPGASGPVDVEVIGVWHEEGSQTGMPIAWVTASGDGVPASLGATTTAAARRPAVVAYDDGTQAGYVVAYPDARGGITARHVEVLPASAPDCTFPPSCDGGTLPDGGTCAGARTPTNPPCVVSGGRTVFVQESGGAPRSTPDPVIGGEQRLFESATPTGDVVAARGRVRAGGAVEIGFAWIDATGVAIAVATIDAASGAITEGAVRHVSATGASRLSLAHVDHGIVSAGATIGGRMVGADELGGFVAVWSTEANAQGVRVGDASGDVVPPGVVDLGTRLFDARAFEGSDERVHVVAHRRASSLVLVPSMCGGTP